MAFIYKFWGNKIEMNQDESTIMKNYYKPIKRIFDIFGGFIGIICMVLVYIILWIPYRIGKNKGEMLFRQLRLGENGKSFEIYKFRTMRENADEYLYQDRKLYTKYVENGYKLEPDEDPRITRLGSFLRKTSLDELPQFINVLKGEMSLVGPRPIIRQELDEYIKLNKDKEFLSMKPGVTGVWQVSGRSNIGYPERVYLEISYVNNDSIFRDLLILFKTIFKVIQKEGAY